MINNNEEMRRLEEQILNSAIPEDENDSRESTATNIKKKIKRYSQSQVQGKTNNPLLIPIAVIGGTVILIISVTIISTFNKNKTSVYRNNIQETNNTDNAMEGFNYLMETQLETQSEQSENGQQPEGELAEQTYTTQQNNNTTEQISVEMQESITPPSSNNYYVSPTIASAVPEDSLIQLGDKVYKLPISLRELEKDGAILITLGSRPPGEEDILHPQMRNGSIQFENKRYIVTLKNGAECTYHDLNVCEVKATEGGSSMYIFNGITIGMEEALLPQNAERIEQDFSKINTFYYWGNLNKELYTTSGRCTRVVVSNATGKVIEVSVFNDATVTN